jgi:hypothetical protein
MFVEKSCLVTTEVDSDANKDNSSIGLEEDGRTRRGIYIEFLAAVCGCQER